MAKEKKRESKTVDIEAEASKILQTVWTLSEDATAFITERVAFQMKNLLRQCRKNVWGVYDEPIDPTTGRKKIWIPLTESAVEAVVKNIDLDTKDINFKAKNSSSIPFTSLVRSAVRNHLEKNLFGEDLDEAIRAVASDGTVVWKTTERKDDEGEITYKNSFVDLLNFAIDPTARSIKETDMVVERIIMTKDEFDRQQFPLNTDKVVPVSTVSRYDQNVNVSTVRASQNYVEVFEGWGLIPTRLLTGKPEDNKLIEGRIVASSNSRGSFIIHKIEKNVKGKRPYEEAWFTRIRGRWYGKGIAEKLLMMQLWINTIVNIRINRSYVSQLGIFKIKSGSGLAPQKLSKLAANGYITVDKMDDIEQFVMQEASQASYKDEEVIKDWSERVTSAFQIVTGEEMPSSTPATNAILLNRSAQTGFTLVKEQMGMFLQRWLKNQALPIIQKSLTKGEVICITGDIDEINTLDDQLVRYLAYEELERLTNEGKVVDPEMVQIELQSARDKLSKMGSARYSELMGNIDFTEYDIEVYVTNEEFEKSILAQNLLQALQLAPEYKDAIMAQVFDIMGLNGSQLKTKQQLQPVQSAQPFESGNLVNKLITENKPEIANPSSMMASATQAITNIK